jgi:hypothetical protein
MLITLSFRPQYLLQISQNETKITISIKEHASTPELSAQTKE